VVAAAAAARGGANRTEELLRRGHLDPPPPRCMEEVEAGELAVRVCIATDRSVGRWLGSGDGDPAVQVANSRRGSGRWPLG
jgi:hypothetical protein